MKNRFYTGNKTGTGIGLAFCKMVMEDLGGHIECKSVHGKYIPSAHEELEFKRSFLIP